jgi:hypothetical protein
MNQIMKLNCFSIGSTSKAPAPAPPPTPARVSTPIKIEPDWDEALDEGDYRGPLPTHPNNLYNEEDGPEKYRKRFRCVFEECEKRFKQRNGECGWAWLVSFSFFFFFFFRFASFVFIFLWTFLGVKRIKRIF